MCLWTVGGLNHRPKSHANGGVPTGEKSEKVGGKPPMGEKPYQESLPAPRATMLS